MGSGFVNNALYDTKSALQVLGCLMKKPELDSDNGEYFLTEQDFTTDLHKVCFGVIHNLAVMGSTEITPQAIDDYLQDRPKSKGIFDAGRGKELLTELYKTADVSSFPYYYNKLKKFSLLRGYQERGVDISDIYDTNNILDMEKMAKQENALEQISLNDLADKIEQNILQVRTLYVDRSVKDAHLVGEGLDDLFLRLRQEPEVGPPLFGGLVNTATMGARLGKYYLRSAPSGIGKTRSMMADACSLSCGEIWDSKLGRWVNRGTCLPTLFISTELELDECQTMALAFLSDINEEKILRSELTFEEQDRINHAIKILSEAPLYIEIVPDFNIKTIENIIKRNLRTNQTQYVFFDYINSSLGLLQEIAQKTTGVAMREDNILFLLSTRLKELAVEFNIFIMSGTQCNASWKTDSLPDANLIKGSTLQALPHLILFIAGVLLNAELTGKAKSEDMPIPSHLLT